MGPRPGASCHVGWDSGSTLIMLPGEGDQVRLRPAPPARTAPSPKTGEPDDGEPAPDWRQDISDPATGLSRLLSERCPTCILRPGDPMHLGAERTAAFIRHALDAGSYVVCHETLTYGDFPDYGPAICRGFFDAYRDRTRGPADPAGGPPPDRGPAPARRQGGRTRPRRRQGRRHPGLRRQYPRGGYRRVLRGIDEGDPAVLDAVGPPAIGPGAGYDQDDLARDLGLEPGDRALPRAVSAYADAFTGAFWPEAERAARDHTS